MSKHYIIFWDDDSVSWLLSIIKQIHVIDSSIKIYVENRDESSKIDTKLKEAYQDILDEYISTLNHNDKIEIIFHTYHSDSINEINPLDYDFALLDAYYQFKTDLEYGINHIAKNLLSSNNKLPIIIATQHFDKIDRNSILKDSSNGVLCFLNKAEISDDSSLSQIIAGMIVSTITKNDKINELITHNQQLISTYDSILYPDFYTFISNNLIIDSSTLEYIRTNLVPFFEYIDKTYYTFPENMRSRFSTSLMLIGHPGTGKSELMNQICKYFEFLSKNNKNNIIICNPISVNNSPSPRLDQIDCFNNLKIDLNKTINQATENKLVIIKIDDVCWTFPKDATDGSLRTYWESYLFLIRRYIEHSNSINNSYTSNTEDTSFSEITNNNKQTHKNSSCLNRNLKGKILWLIARNSNNEVSDLFLPLKSIISDIEIKFPKDFDTRKKIVELKLKSLNIEIEPSALQYLIMNTLNMEPRKFIGDNKSTPGILGNIIASQKEKAQILYRNMTEEDKKIYTNKKIKIFLDTVKQKLNINNKDGETGIKTSYDNNKDGETGIKSPSGQPWFPKDKKEELYEIVKKLVNGSDFEHNPDKIKDRHGLIMLRATLAIIYYDAKNNNLLGAFDSIFGFGQKGRTTVKISQYLQGKGNNSDFKQIFEPKPNRRNYTTDDIYKDGYDLCQQGISLNDAHITLN